jgi:hypothetical protein
VTRRRLFAFGMNGAIPGVPTVPPTRLAELGMLEAATLWPTPSLSTRSRRALGIAKHAINWFPLCEHALVEVRKARWLKNCKPDHIGQRLCTKRAGQISRAHVILILSLSLTAMLYPQVNTSYKRGQHSHRTGSRVLEHSPNFLKSSGQDLGFQVIRTILLLDYAVNSSDVEMIWSASPTCRAIRQA